MNMRKWWEVTDLSIRGPLFYIIILVVTYEEKCEHKNTIVYGQRISILPEEAYHAQYCTMIIKQY